MKKIMIWVFGLSLFIGLSAAQKENNEDKIVCTICHEDLRDGHQITAVLPCHKTHEFHVHCISKWNAQSDTCPACRTKLKEELSDTRLIESLLTQAENSEKKIAELNTKLIKSRNKRKAAELLKNSDAHLTAESLVANDTRFTKAQKEIARKEKVIRRLSRQKRSLTKKLRTQESLVV